MNDKELKKQALKKYEEELAFDLQSDWSGMRDSEKGVDHKSQQSSSEKTTVENVKAKDGNRYSE